MPAWLTAALEIVKQVLGLIGVVKAEHDHEETKAEGRAEQTAEQTGQIEKARSDREKLDEELAHTGDDGLDSRLDKWMRD